MTMAERRDSSLTENTGPGNLDLATEEEKEIEETLLTVDDTTFKRDDWNIVFTETRVALASVWDQLVIYLGLSFDLINNTIRAAGSPIQCWSEALRQWILQNYNIKMFGEPSWRTLLRAVSHVDKLQFRKLAAHHQVECTASDVEKDSPNKMVGIEEEQPARKDGSPTPSPQYSRYCQLRVLRKHHAEIRENLNYMSIIPYLNQYDLIPHSEYVELTPMPDMVGLETNYAKIDKLIAIIPNCGHRDFLTRFIRCLRDSVHDAGEAHEQLADTLQRALEEEIDISPESDEDSESQSAERWLLVNYASGQLEMHVEREVPRRPGTCCGRRVRSLTVLYSMLFALLLVGIIGVACVARVPRSPLPRPLTVQGYCQYPLPLTQLGPSLHTAWISDIQLKLDCDGCSGSAYFLPGRNCNSLATQVDLPPTLYSYTYLLPGSQINVTIPEDSKPNAWWILSSVSAFLKIQENRPNRYQGCDPPFHTHDGYHCFPKSKYNSSHPIVFNVTTAGYYSLYAYDGYLRSNIFVLAKAYNTSAIFEDDLVRSNVTVTAGSSAQIKVNSFLEFDNEGCILTKVHGCMEGDRHNWTVVATSVRKDAQLLPGLMLIISFVIFVCVVIINVIVCGIKYYNRS